MEKPLLDSWQESSRSLAGLFKNISDKNVAMAQDLYSNLASKQWAKMTLAAFEMTAKMGTAENYDPAKVAFPLQIPSNSDIQSFSELSEIYRAAFEKICDSQVSITKSTIDLFSAYAENLKKSRDIDDVVATNFDFLGNLMMTVKSGALDSLKVGDSIKTALVAWSENSLHRPGDFTH